MSLYTIATSSLTTPDDRRRRPAVNQGQVRRTLALCLVFAVALVAMARHSHARESAPRSGGFAAFVEGLYGQAHRRGVSRETFDRAFDGVTPDEAVLAKTHNQAEFRKTTAQYLASAVSPTRIETGQERGRAYKEVLERAEARYGVDPYVVLGVWGLETNFGKNPGDLSTIRCLATLAYARYRGDYFRKELLDALDILQAGHIGPQEMRGSWAGAMGQTQFMPSAFKRYAVDFSGEGRRDIWRSVPDALGSTAYFLKAHGWVDGLPWGYEVVAPSAAAGDGKAMRPFTRWTEAGFRRADGGPLPREGEAALLAPAGADGPHFLVTRNFKVIKSYNNATSYALGVALLGDRIAGAGPLQASWPVAAR